jgi:hypothetical protein
MRRHVILQCALLCGLALPFSPAHATPQQDYLHLDLYLKLQDADCSEKNGDFHHARAIVQDCYDALEKIHLANPDWESSLVESDLEDCSVRLAALQGKVKAPPSAAAVPSVSSASLPQDYLGIYVKLNYSERSEQNGDFQNALLGFQDCWNRLQNIQTGHPDWEPVLVKSRLSDCRAKINELLPKLNFASLGMTPVAMSLPFPLNLPPPRKRAVTTDYPWKANIITTVFSIGESRKNARGWNPHWTRDNGGLDNADKMSGYASSRHASTLNPFYVALPFNDLAYPKQAALWIPAGWRKPSQNGKPVSACQGRWVEMKNRDGRTCFAQWEDVGPLRTDHAEYVFGSEGPDTPNRAGLNVSPAVALYLGIDRHGSGITSWRFVDDDDVMPGLWLKYNEQAVLFAALRQTSGVSSRTPLKIKSVSAPIGDTP